MEIETLKQLAIMGAHKEQISLSSSILAQALGSSPQTAARRLSSLEDLGYITRVVTSEGQKIRVTEKGLMLLKSEYHEYRYLFEGEQARIIRGMVASGLGEGQYYISRDGYRRQFMEKLGFEPYPGTLNIKLDEPFLPPDLHAISIDGFRDEDRTFGECKCYKIKVNGIEAAIVRPGRSNYPLNLVEVIAPVGLRKSLCLKDGAEVKVTLE